MNNNSDADLICVTQTLAKDAYVLFQLGKYGECVKVLNQILEKKPDDPKVNNEFTCFVYLFRCGLELRYVLICESR